MEIHGRVSGNIEATRKIEIRSTGHVVADLKTPALVIENGGTLDGRSRMTGDRAADGTTGAGKEEFEGVDEVN